MAGPRRPSRPLAAAEAGFTLVEVMVAAAVLLVGVLGVMGIVVQADGVTWSNRAREQGVALQREVVEAARSIPYDQLTQNAIVSRIQGQPGLADSTPGTGGWTIQRRGITFTLAVGTCSVDDPSDQYGPHETAGYCRSGTGQTTPTQCAGYLGASGDIAGAGTVPTGSVAVGDCGIDLNRDGGVDGLVDTSGGTCTNCSGSDTNPNDYKRVVVNVRWDRGLGKRYALQSATVPNPGMSAAPAVTNLTASKANPILTGDQLIDFTATLNSTPAAVAWYVDGTAHGQASGTTTSWTFQWDLGALSTGATPAANEVLDGTYVVSAKGFDTYGQAGTARAWTLVVNRSVPYAPLNFDAGRNDGSAYLEWSRNAERDIEGYRVYRHPSDNSGDQLVCSLTTQLRCRDGSMPGSDQQYYVVAVDKDNAGNLREGRRSGMFTVPATNTPPSPPPTLQAVKSGTSTVLSWTAATDPDPGDSIRYYRIYRDGTGFVANLYDRTSLGSTTSYVDDATGGDEHTYWVVAVDQQYAESRPLGSGVTK